MTQSREEVLRSLAAKWVDSLSSGVGVEQRTQELTGMLLDAYRVGKSEAPEIDSSHVQKLWDARLCTECGCLVAGKHICVVDQKFHPDDQANTVILALLDKMQSNSVKIDWRQFNRELDQGAMVTLHLRHDDMVVVREPPIRGYKDE